jgi:hypothetical protein
MVYLMIFQTGKKELEREKKRNGTILCRKIKNLILKNYI